MSGTSNESEDGMLYNFHSESPLIDDGNGGSSGGGAILKKGPWTSNEDAILVEYVKKHGEGNWNAVQKHSGLSRCGKSCRLRWANHLRPNLKKGAFTPEEETLILELHAKMGNKWARMASYMPGRTDNEIKNYWNTRVKRRQRAGLPLYPHDLCLQVFQENQQAENAGSLSCGELGQHESLEADAFEIPDVVFSGLHQNNKLYSYASDFPPTDAVLMKSIPQFYDFAPQTIHRQKRVRESSEALMRSFPPQNDQFPNDKISSLFGDPFSQEFDPGQSLLYLDAGQGVHPLLNGNPSASVPVNGDVKSELPSLQYPDTDLSNTWGNSSPLPSLESVDTFIQSPAGVDVAQFGPAKRENSGLLDDLIQEAMHLSRVKKNFSEKSLNSSSFTPADGALAICANEWDGNTEPPSPLGQSATSFLNECISPGGSSFDDTSLAENFTGNHVKPEPFETDFSPDKENESNKPMEFIRPDALLDSDLLDFFKDHGTVTDAIATLFDRDLVSDCNIEIGSGSSSSSQDGGYSRCLWGTMPSAVFQMSDRH